MESVSVHRQKALKSIQMAKYLLTTTYPIIKEPKTLLSISDHVFQSFIASVSALLLSERTKKTIPPYHNTNESKLNSFKQNLVKKYELNDYLETIEKITNLSKGHKEAAIEFSRDKKYVICNNQFSDIQTLSEENVKTFISKARDFAAKVTELTANG